MTDSDVFYAQQSACYGYTWLFCSKRKNFYNKRIGINQTFNVLSQFFLVEIDVFCIANNCAELVCAVRMLQ